MWNVFFYYLRKMQRYGNGIKIKATTTDFVFDSQMRGLYEGFLQDNSALTQQTSLLSYVIGFYMPCNTNWSLVDHVLIPVRMSNSAHWILCHFDIQHMCLNVNNSYHKVVRKALVLEAVQPFSVIIPRFLFHTNFYDGKGIAEEDAIKPLVVKIVPKLPQQKNGGDCGIYVIKYAQYFINGQLDEMSKTFNIPHIRRNLCAQLYTYAKKKQDEDYDTDNEWLSKDSL